MLAMLALVILAGGAAILLQTNQAPLILSTQEPELTPVQPPAIEPEPLLAPKQGLTTEEFRTLGAEVMSSLPTKASLKSLKAEDAHNVPLPILLAGEKLGGIAEAVSKDPALEAEAMLLYESCAVSVQYPDSVRALCFYNYRNLSEKSGRAMKSVPAPIRQLADKLGS